MFLEPLDKDYSILENKLNLAVNNKTKVNRRLMIISFFLSICSFTYRGKMVTSRNII